MRRSASKRGVGGGASNVLVLDEGVLVDGLDDVFEEDLGGEGVTVVHDGFAILAVPTVHCRNSRRETSMRIIQDD